MVGTTLSYQMWIKMATFWNGLSSFAHSQTWLRFSAQKRVCKILLQSILAFGLEHTHKQFFFLSERILLAHPNNVHLSFVERRDCDEALHGSRMHCDLCQPEEHHANEERPKSVRFKETWVHAKNCENNIKNKTCHNLHTIHHHSCIAPSYSYSPSLCLEFKSQEVLLYSTSHITCERLQYHCCAWCCNCMFQKALFILPLLHDIAVSNIYYFGCWSVVFLICQIFSYI